MFGLTRGECLAMAQASGLAADDFSLADQAQPEFLEFLQAIHPAFLQTMPGGRRRRLRLTPEGACCLLAQTGCSLPVAARPLYCRLYPFWFNEHGRLMLLRDHSCLAQEGAGSQREVMGRLGLEEEGLRGLFAQFLALAQDHQGSGGALLA
jgi:Fe-S-cluster containining protein